MTTEPACAGQHPAPPRLEAILPPLATAMPQVSQALNAAMARCAPCLNEHRRATINQPPLLHQATTIVLMYASAALNAKAREPGTDAEEMLRRMSPDLVDLLAEPTRAYLRALPVKEARETPGASLTAAWDGARLAELGAGLTPDDRQVAWKDAIGILSGIVHGVSRAREGADQ